MSLPGRAKESFAEIQTIYAAIKSRDANEARKRAKRHVITRVPQQKRHSSVLAREIREHRWRVTPHSVRVDSRGFHDFLEVIALGLQSGAELS